MVIHAMKNKQKLMLKTRVCIWRHRDLLLINYTVPNFWLLPSRSAVG